MAGLPMKIAFRADASLQIGSGHVMRCLTLADALRKQGAQCHFICRAHLGNMIDVIRQRGYRVTSLSAYNDRDQYVADADADAGERFIQDVQESNPKQVAHSAWLGCTWEADAKETALVIGSLKLDWLVVDHYAIDQRWERMLYTHCGQLMVIDDLADRPHHCDMLLDQNLGRLVQDYSGLVPAFCEILTGPKFALLRPEFAALRAFSLRRRQTKTVLQNILITMGGVDLHNATEVVLQTLKTCSLPAECRITVVMGLTAPWFQSIQELAANMPFAVDVLVNVDDMAHRMANSDLAIGAAGSTSLGAVLFRLANIDAGAG